MPRRVSLPGAAELFRPTQPPPVEPGTVSAHRPDPPSMVGGTPVEEPRRRGSGRVRHDEKITVYVSTEELLALEEARLALRSRHRVAVDRGRLVRAAIATVLADLDARGDQSDLVRRLSQR